MRGRLDPVEVELGDPVDVLEDPRQLARHPLDLLVGEPQPGQPRDVQHLLPVDHGGVILGARDGDLAASAS